MLFTLGSRGSDSTKQLKCGQFRPEPSGHLPHVPSSVWGTALLRGHVPFSDLMLRCRSPSPGPHLCNCPWPTHLVMSDIKFPAPTALLVLATGHQYIPAVTTTITVSIIIVTDVCQVFLSLYIMCNRCLILS